MKYLVVALVLILSSCASSVTNIPTGTVAEIERERQYQAHLATQKKIREEYNREQRRLEQKARLVKVTKRISQAGSYLCNRLIPAEGLCLYGIELSKERRFNAYADGRKIVLSPAAVNFGKTDDELAVIIAHEYAHNMMQHVQATQGNVLTGMLLGSLLDVLAGKHGFDTGSTFEEAGTKMAHLRYSKKFEAEADYVGIYLMELAGYDTRQAPGVWRKMSLRFPDEIYVTSTHPSHPERFVTISKTIEEINRKKVANLSLQPELKF